MRILLTGSNGFVGGRVAATARRRGWQVIGLGRQPRPNGPVEAYHRHDLADPLRLDETVDAVVHCAALASPWARPEAYRRANVDGTRHVLEWARSHGTPPVHYVSSSSVFYIQADQLGITEDSPIPAPERQINVYSRSKLAGERLMRAYAGAWSIVRPRAVFGPGDTVLLPRVVQAARAGRLPLLVRRDPSPVLTDLTHVDVVAHYIVEAVAHGVTGAVNLTNGEPVELYPFLFGLLDDLGLPRPARRVPVGAAMALARGSEIASATVLGYREPPITTFGVSMFTHSKTFDVTRCRTLLGPPPFSVEDGRRDLVQWWRNGGH
ncbi:MAG: NAD(P)-dependent oxidoreductase [Micropruina sp.]|uniref:NAD-dependent epimerase/dehydratase family protein n=1 Tax=Micropruina sp. TaxID=2737536 RepID=UPI0039E43C92